MRKRDSSFENGKKSIKYCLFLLLRVICIEDGDENGIEDAGFGLVLSFTKLELLAENEGYSAEKRNRLFNLFEVIIIITGYL
jgi:hypothetical protein